MGGTFGTDDKPSKPVHETLTSLDLFGGIFGFGLAAERAGFRCIGYSEIQKDCRELLARRRPHVPQLGDVRSVGGGCIQPGSVTLLTGGWPCQDLSVAGKRAGLAGERSGLFHEVARIIGELRPRWFVLENVPGLLSSHGGRDFATVLRRLAECGYGVSYRVLDAQYFGVAQRRQRVFLVGSLGSGRSAEVLFESPGVCRDTPPSRESGKRVAAVLRSRTSSPGVNAPGRGGEDDVNLVETDVCGTLSDGAHQGGGSTDKTPTPEGFLPAVAWALQERDAKGSDSSTKEGHLIPVRQGGFFSFRPCGQDGFTAGPISPPLAASDGGNTQPAVAFKPSHFTRGKDGAPAETTPPLSHDADKGDQEAVVFQTRIARNGRGQPERVCPALNGSDAGATSDMRPVVAASMSVRRLTPLECERLQGFPDGWTEGFSDSARYRMLGNAVAVPCVEWILRRVAKAMTP